jgi:hypothetical protein
MTASRRIAWPWVLALVTQLLWLGAPALAQSGPEDGGDAVEETSSTPMVVGTEGEGSEGEETGSDGAEPDAPPSTTPDGGEGAPATRAATRGVPTADLDIPEPPPDRPLGEAGGDAEADEEDSLLPPGARGVFGGPPPAVADLDEDAPGNVVTIYSDESGWKLQVDGEGLHGLRHELGLHADR